MSNEGTEDRIQRIVDEVSDVWILTNRDDLLDDCISYVEDNDVYFNGMVDTKDLVIEYLSMKCADVMSMADLESMARAEEETKISSYQEADQGV
tara:strand:+ start:47 stop:328 length:282 start_codon:yes stop_codon:yes gene_type:complete